MKIPVFVHNLRNYDTHFLMQHVKKEYGEISVIPNNTEKYISYEIGDLVFKDSFQFMNTSLAELVRALDTEKLVNVKQYLQMQVVQQREPEAGLIDDEDEEGEDADGEEEEDSACFSSGDYRNAPLQELNLNEEESMPVNSKLEMLARKGVYPYEYMDSFASFDETQLPTRENFYSRLTQSGI